MIVLPLENPRDDLQMLMLSFFYDVHLPLFIFLCFIYFIPSFYFFMTYIFLFLLVFSSLLPSNFSSLLPSHFSSLLPSISYCRNCTLSIAGYSPQGQSRTWLNDWGCTHPHFKPQEPVAISFMTKSTIACFVLKQQQQQQHLASS